MIKLYSTHCPRCNVLVAKLNQKNIKFEEITDINTIEKMRIMSVPMLLVDDKLMDFKEAVTWINAQ